jgi:FlaA1/EpsC-like NDP-sugar epimerase
MGSRGSVIPFFQSIKNNKELPITDIEMTRFMITLEQAIELVWESFSDSIGGEIYVRKIPSMKIIDIAKIISPKSKIKIVGIRPGEKIHEQMIGTEDSPTTYEYEKYFKILPTISNFHNDQKRIKNGKLVQEGFSYNSGSNGEWMTEQDLVEWLNGYTGYNY